jgi:chloramphenicol 3-O-phosphotransferase
VPEVLILTGPPASGKSSVARALAERYDRVAHIEVDTLRHFVTPTGYVAPWGPPEAWQRQQELATRNAGCLARNFLIERFAVIIDDVVVTRTEVEAFVAELKEAVQPVHYVRLLPSLAACQERNRGRSEGRMPAARVEQVWRAFAAAEPYGASIDSSELSLYATADRLQALTTSGESIVWRPEAS